MKLLSWHIAEFVFIAGIGTLLHFAFELSGQCAFVGYFAPINESVWEHLKLIFWPALLFSFIQYAGFGRHESDFFMVKLVSIFCSVLFVVIFFYTYSGVLGFNLLIIDILTFFMGAFVCSFFSYRLFGKHGGNDKADNFRAVVILLLIGLCFAGWTYNPPELGIFWG